MSKRYKAPFDAEGNLIHSVEGWRPVAEWREVRPFVATIHCVEMRYGGHSKYTVWSDSNGHQFPMFIADLVALIQTVTVQPDRNINTWIVGKRSSYYGIRLATEKEVEELGRA